MNRVSSMKSLVVAAVLITTAGVATMSGQGAQGQPFQALHAALAAMQAQVANLAAAVADLQNQGGGSGPTEVWRLGSQYSDINTGQLTASNYYFCSGGCPTSIINAFDTISPDPKRIRRVGVIVSNRTGSYGQGLHVVIEVRSFNGTLQRVLSTTPVNLETINQLAWVDVPIIDSDAAIIAPGEYLASHVTHGGASGGTLNLRMHLRAEVEEP